MSPRVCKLVLWVIAAFYACGALVHLLNMAGFSGFDWRTAPLKWQVLDIAYLDLLVGFHIVTLVLVTAVLRLRKG